MIMWYGGIFGTFYESAVAVHAEKSLSQCVCV